ncbi:basic salivary proline-rich protein 2-like [Homarus americanus]|uniref:basic salivary proline-rich protein 2-like n=1 Tax=Homarus americanus TaxID=6706 RepID=UPI001C485B61|nr:basic salivary proline-rich protein 2-like [Homarus americanus]
MPQEAIPGAAAPPGALRTGGVVPRGSPRNGGSSRGPFQRRWYPQGQRRSPEDLPSATVLPGDLIRGSGYPRSLIETSAPPGTFFRWGSDPRGPARGGGVPRSHPKGSGAPRGPPRDSNTHSGPPRGNSELSLGAAVPPVVTTPQVLSIGAAASHGTFPGAVAPPKALPETTALLGTPSDADAPRDRPKGGGAPPTGNRFVKCPP